MFPFDRPKNYGEMLNKIGIFTFFVALALTWYLARKVPSISAVLNSEETTFTVASLHVPILYVIASGVVALLFRIFRMHDKISDLFAIRERFDTDKILIPLCEAVGLSVSDGARKVLRAERNLLMDRVFYKYASFEDPKIRKPECWEQWSCGLGIE